MNSFRSNLYSSLISNTITLDPNTLLNLDAIVANEIVLPEPLGPTIKVCVVNVWLIHHVTLFPSSGFIPRYIQFSFLLSISSSVINRGYRYIAESNSILLDGRCFCSTKIDYR